MTSSRMLVLGALLVTALSPAESADRFARGDSDARYVHHIDLFDAANRKITPDSTTPYSTVTTCGRCHDYDAISHGWHFNAVLPEAEEGRPGEPWIWTDVRTGTQLPLSYRPWPHTFRPDEVGISRFEMTKHFGGRTPGGLFTAAPEPASEEPGSESRWPLTGSLAIDCMACHAASGAYDFNARRQQIDDENFAFAATAALRLGTVDGRTSRIRTGSDPADASVQEQLPTVKYDPSRFGPDGTVFMDILRAPDSQACYQCHSQRYAEEDEGLLPVWSHDDDVHLRAGMECSDCHRNGIDHQMVRGFPGEEHPAGAIAATMSCAGCHLGQGGEPAQGSTHGEIAAEVSWRAGRLGAPIPQHAGLPPIHFEKLACTACHSGPAPREEALRVMTSLAHGLGTSAHRTGQELPAIAGPVYAPGADGQITPQRAMWPAFWGLLEEDSSSGASDAGEGESARPTVRPLPPEAAYVLTRRTLRVRRDFVAEVLGAELSRAELTELLGEERATLDAEQWSDAERQQVDEAIAAKSQQQFQEKISAALSAIEEEYEDQRAVYVSGGVVYAQGEEAGTIREIEIAEGDLATSMVSWPIAHNVRPAGWSLGVAGCAECHSQDARLFTSTVTPIGPGPESPPPITMASLQGLDEDQRLAWNELFQGRGNFKYVIAVSLAILAIVLLVGLAATGARLAYGTR